MFGKMDRLLKDTIKCYAGNSILEKVNQHGYEALKPEVEQKKVTIYAQRWDGFDKTRIYESFSPNDILNFFSDYLSTFTNCINRNDGIIFNVNESQILAVFSTDNNSQNPNNASFCAIKCLQQIEEFSILWSKIYDNFNLAIGIDSGLTLLGNFGSKDGLYFNVLGQSVNSAKLLIRQIDRESKILITENVKNEISNRFNTKEFNQIRIKGLQDQINLYELLSYT